MAQQEPVYRVRRHKGIVVWEEVDIHVCPKKKQKQKSCPQCRYPLHEGECLYEWFRWA